MIKTVEDYLPQLQEHFPTVSFSELRKTINFGLRIYGYVNKRGADVLIYASQFTKLIAYTGSMQLDPLKKYLYGLKKWQMKERILYSFKNTEWDGYYYFGIADEHHHILLNQLNSKKRYVNLEKVYARKVVKELYHDHSKDHIYRFKYPCDIGYSIYWKKFRELKVNIEFVGINTESTWYRNLQTHSTED